MTLTWTPWAALSRDALYALLALRQQVFVVEQRCPYLDADGLDPHAWHLQGHAQDGSLTAYLRAFPPGVLRAPAVIGRVIVHPAARAHGLGAALMREALARLGPVPCHLSAQAHLAPWYTRLGFTVSGPGYLEDGIPHVPMDRP